MQSVPLQGDQYAGLGFNIYGNSKDGIYVREVLQKGPALATGKIEKGDRIMSITVAFEHMAFEDALTILSYASPYNVRLQMLKKPGFKRPNLKHELGEETGKQPRFHPLIRRHSAVELLGSNVDDNGLLPAIRSKTVQYVTVDIDPPHKVSIQDETDIVHDKRHGHHRSHHKSDRTAPDEALKVIDETAGDFDATYYKKHPGKVHNLFHTAPYRTVDSTSNVRQLKVKEHEKQHKADRKLQFYQDPEEETWSHRHHGHRHHADGREVSESEQAMKAADGKTKHFDAVFDATYYKTRPEEVHDLIHVAPYRTVDSTSNVAQKLKEARRGKRGENDSHSHRVNRKPHFFQDPENHDQPISATRQSQDQSSKWLPFAGPWLGEVEKPPDVVQKTRYVEQASQYEVPYQYTSTYSAPSTTRSAPVLNNRTQGYYAGKSTPQAGRSADYAAQRVVRPVAITSGKDVWSVPAEYTPRVIYKMKHIAPFEEPNFTTTKNIHRESQPRLATGDKKMDAFLGNLRTAKGIAGAGFWEVLPEQVPSRVYLLRHIAPYQHVDSSPVIFYPPESLIASIAVAKKSVVGKPAAYSSESWFVRPEDVPSKVALMQHTAPYTPIAVKSYGRQDERPVRHMARDYSSEKLIDQLRAAKRATGAKTWEVQMDQVPSDIHQMTLLAPYAHVDSSPAMDYPDVPLIDRLAQAKKAVLSDQTWNVEERQVPKEVFAMNHTAPYEHRESSPAPRSMRDSKKGSFVQNLFGGSDSKRGSSSKLSERGSEPKPASTKLTHRDSSGRLVDGERPEKAKFSLTGFLSGKSNKGHEDDVYDELLNVPSKIHEMKHADQTEQYANAAVQTCVHMVPVTFRSPSSDARSATGLDRHSSREAWVSEDHVVAPLSSETLSARNRIDFENPPIPEAVFGMTHTAPYQPPDVDARLPPVRSDYDFFSLDESMVPKEVHSMHHSSPFDRYIETRVAFPVSEKTEKPERGLGGKLGRFLGKSKPDPYQERWYSNMPVLVHTMTWLNPASEYKINSRFVKDARRNGDNRDLGILGNQPNLGVSTEVVPSRSVDSGVAAEPYAGATGATAIEKFSQEFFQDKFVVPEASDSTHFDGYVPYYGAAPQSRISVNEYDIKPAIRDQSVLSREVITTQMQPTQASASPHYAPSWIDSDRYDPIDLSKDAEPPVIINEIWHLAPAYKLAPGQDGLSAYQVESLRYRTRRSASQGTSSERTPTSPTWTPAELFHRKKKEEPRVEAGSRKSRSSRSTEFQHSQSFSDTPPATIAPLKHNAPYKPLSVYQDGLSARGQALRDEGTLEPIPYIQEEDGTILFAFPMHHEAPVAQLAPTMDGLSAYRLAEAIAGKEFVSTVTPPVSVHNIAHHAPFDQVSRGVNNKVISNRESERDRGATSLMTNLMSTASEHSSDSPESRKYRSHRNRQEAGVEPTRPYSTIIVLEGQRIPLHSLGHVEQSSPYRGPGYRLERNDGVVIDMRGRAGYPHEYEWEERRMTLDPPQSSMRSDVTYVVTARPANVKDQTATRSSGTDPYAELSYRDRLDVLRLSYEDTGVSRSTPDLAAESPSPSVSRRIIQGRPPIRQGVEKAEPMYAERISDFPVTPPPLIDQGRLSSEGYYGASKDVITVGPGETAVRTKTYYSSAEPGNQGTSWVTSEDYRSTSHGNQPILKRDSGYGTLAHGGITIETRERPESTSPLSPSSPVSPASLDQSQYQKLLYFQQQIAKQNEELAQLGISVPNLDPLPPLRDIRPSHDDI